LAEGGSTNDLPAGRGCGLSHERARARRKGTVAAETAKLFVMGLPCIMTGTWLGLKLFEYVDEAMFRKIVVALLLISGAMLII
jgi:uncharacterized membrane protein YfcA